MDHKIPSSNKIRPSKASTIKRLKGIQERPIRECVQIAKIRKQEVRAAVAKGSAELKLALERAKKTGTQQKTSAKKKEGRSTKSESTEAGPTNKGRAPLPEAEPVNEGPKKKSTAPLAEAEPMLADQVENVARRVVQLLSAPGSTTNNAGPPQIPMVQPPFYQQPFYQQPFAPQLFYGPQQGHGAQHQQPPMVYGPQQGHGVQHQQRPIFYGPQQGHVTQQQQLPMFYGPLQGQGAHSQALHVNRNRFGGQLDQHRTGRRARGFIRDQLTAEEAARARRLRHAGKTMEQIKEIMRIYPYDEHNWG